MKNIDELIGRKMEGFKFENNSTHDYHPEMDDYLGEEGIITEFSENGYYKVQFENDYWFYPAEFVPDHLIE